MASLFPATAQPFERGDGLSGVLGGEGGRVLGGVARALGPGLEEELVRRHGVPSVGPPSSPTPRQEKTKNIKQHTRARNQKRRKNKDSIKVWAERVGGQKATVNKVMRLLLLCKLKARLPACPESRVALLS